MYEQTAKYVILQKRSNEEKPSQKDVLLKAPER